MLEFGKREWGAVAAIAAAATVGGTGWWTLHQRAAISSRDIKPTFADGAPVQIANADGTLVVPAQGPPESPNPSTTKTNPSGAMEVYVIGAVKNPGVYRIGAGGRIADAVNAAGGFKGDAQKEALNLADYLRDADEIYIPSRKDSQKESSAPKPLLVSGTAQRLRAEYTSRKDAVAVTVAEAPPPQITVRPLIIPGSALPSPSESPSPVPAPRLQGRILGKPDMGAAAVAASTGLPAPTPASLEGTAPPKVARGVSAPESASLLGKEIKQTNSKFKEPGDGVVDINTASLEELERVPGVGPTTAQRILKYREQVGPFTSVSQLQDIKGIGPKKLADMEPFLVAN